MYKNKFGLLDMTIILLVASYLLSVNTDSIYKCDENTHGKADEWAFAPIL